MPVLAERNDTETSSVAMRHSSVGARTLANSTCLRSVASVPVLAGATDGILPPSVPQAASHGVRSLSGAKDPSEWSPRHPFVWRERHPSGGMIWKTSIQSRWLLSRPGAVRNMNADSRCRRQLPVTRNRGRVLHAAKRRQSRGRVLYATKRRQSRGRVLRAASRCRCRRSLVKTGRRDCGLAFRSDYY